MSIFSLCVFIALAMLGFADARSWHFQEALDSIRVENAIQVDGCTNSRQVMIESQLDLSLKTAFRSQNSESRTAGCGSLLNLALAT